MRVSAVVPRCSSVRMFPVIIFVRKAKIQNLVPAFSLLYSNFYLWKYFLNVILRKSMQQVYGAFYL